jgi:hypothetical protein
MMFPVEKLASDEHNDWPAAMNSRWRLAMTSPTGGVRCCRKGVMSDRELKLVTLNKIHFEGVLSK